jgi:Integrase core domain.
LKNSIPIRTFTDWQENRPGYLEADTVAHCGDSVEGFYLNTLMAVDVASGWAEGSAVWGKSQERVGSAIHGIRRRFPFPILGLDTDNGGEFINQHLFSYCRREHITFTRSRSYKKNDNCYVEQKNGNVVRRVIGYDRYNSRQALETLNQIYYLLHLYSNFFQPTMKLLSKSRHGARVHKVYDTAKTPYQRLLYLDVLTEAKKAELATSYSRLNPIKLLKQINQSLEYLWTLKERTITLSHRINQE